MDASGVENAKAPLHLWNHGVRRTAEPRASSTFPALSQEEDGEIGYGAFLIEGNMRLKVEPMNTMKDRECTLTLDKMSLKVGYVVRKI